MSVSTKLLLTISFLLTAPIFFLNVSAVKLFLNDKRAYIYDSQATAVVLAGREFVSFLNNSMGSLRLILGSVDISKTLSEQNKNSIKFFLDNQQSIVGVQLYSLNTQTRAEALVYEHFLPTLLEKIKLRAEDFAVEPKIFESRRADLEKNGFFFMNITKAGQIPTVAIVYQGESRDKIKFPMAIAYVSLDHFINSSSNSFNKFSIANKRGEILFHSDSKVIYARQPIHNDAIFQSAWGSTVNSGVQEYKTSDGTLTLGSFYKPGLELVALSQIEYEKAMQATYTLTEKFVVLGIGALGLMIALGLIFSKRLTAPLSKLFRATTQVSSGNFDVNLPISSRDEFGALTNSFVTMSKKISELVQEMVDKVRVDQEIEIAKTVQQSLFPPNSIKNKDVNIYSHYQSASECGGDWWGYFHIGSKHYIIIADATGHGLPSALMTASARSCFSVVEKLAKEAKASMSTAEMLSIANRVVYDSAQGKIMLTCFACILDFDEHTISYSSAAHNPPWIFSPKVDGTFKMTSLIARGQRLGEGPDLNEEYEVKTNEFKRGDTFIFYTDGLLEGKNLDGAQYGKKRARQVIEETLKTPVDTLQSSSDATLTGTGGKEISPKTIIKTLMADFLKHNTGKPLDDDVTLAIVRTRT